MVAEDNFRKQIRHPVTCKDCGKRMGRRERYSFAQVGFDKYMCINIACPGKKLEERSRA